MLYLAIPAHNEVATIGVLLWRLRTVLAEFPREYEVVVYDDASTDDTAIVAEQYQAAMPVTVLRGAAHVGYAGAVDALARHISAQTRYPRRDAMLLLQADFTDPPGIVPEFARRFEGGADLVVGERSTVSDAPVVVRRLFRAAQWALRPFVRVDGVQDLTASMRLVRISALRDLLRQVGDAPVSVGDTWTANADLLTRLVPHARRIESVPVEPTYGVRMRETRRITVRDALAALSWGWSHRGRRAAASAGANSGADALADAPREKAQTLDRLRGDVAEEPRNGQRDSRRSGGELREPREPRELRASREPKEPRQTQERPLRPDVPPPTVKDLSRPARKPREQVRSPYADVLDTFEDPCAPPAPRRSPLDRVLPPVERDAENAEEAEKPEATVGGDEKEGATGDDSVDSRERKRRRNRRSRRRRTRLSPEPGEESVAIEGEETSASTDEQDTVHDAAVRAEESADQYAEYEEEQEPRSRRGRRRRGPKTLRDPEGTGLPSSDHASPDDASSKHRSPNTVETDDAGAENEGLNADGTPQAKRRGRRGRRGGARRSRGRHLGDDTPDGEPSADAAGESRREAPDAPRAEQGDEER